MRRKADGGRQQEEGKRKKAIGSGQKVDGRDVFNFSR